MNNPLNNKQGFTLIELLAAIAIIGIFAATMLPVISNSLRHTYQSGQQSKALFTTQSLLDNAISQTTTTEISDSATQQFLSKAQSNTTLTIKINVTNINVTGDLLKSQAGYGSNGQTASLYYFKPK